MNERDLPVFLVAAMICFTLGFVVAACDSETETAHKQPERPVSAVEQPVAFSISENATMRVLVPLVAKWEGKRNTAYFDRIAQPPVWTVCYGETRGVGPGDSYSDVECTAMLRIALVTYRDGLHRYFGPNTKRYRLPPERDAAFVSLAYNVGIAGAGKSTAVRRLNNADIRGACTAIGWWNKAGGRVIRGLVNRRREETALCLQGVA